MYFPIRCAVRYDGFVVDATPTTADAKASADPTEDAAAAAGGVLRGDGGSVPDGDDAAPNVFARACTSRPVLQNISGRWGALTLAGLRDEPLRFSALRRRVDGISEKMLSQTLQALERDGFVVRDVQATIPPRVEYSLTPLGVTVATRLLDLIELLESSMDQVTAAQQAYDAR